MLSLEMGVAKCPRGNGNEKGGEDFPVWPPTAAQQAVPVSGACLPLQLKAQPPGELASSRGACRPAGRVQLLPPETS